MIPFSDEINRLYTAIFDKFTNPERVVQPIYIWAFVKIMVSNYAMLMKFPQPDIHSPMNSYFMLYCMCLMIFIIMPEWFTKIYYNLTQPTELSPKFEFYLDCCTCIFAVSLIPLIHGFI